MREDDGVVGYARLLAELARGFEARRPCAALVLELAAFKPAANHRGLGGIDAWLGEVARIFSARVQRACIGATTGRLTNYMEDCRLGQVEILAHALREIPTRLDALLASKVGLSLHDASDTTAQAVLQRAEAACREAPSGTLARLASELPRRDEAGTCWPMAPEEVFGPKLLWRWHPTGRQGEASLGSLSTAAGARDL